MPINLPNGNDVEEIVLPNGANASEVYGPNGKLVWEGTAIPDSEINLDNHTNTFGLPGDASKYGIIFEAEYEVSDIECDVAPDVNLDTYELFDSSENLIDSGTATGGDTVTMSNLNLNRNQVYFLVMTGSENDTTASNTSPSLPYTSDSLEVASGALDSGGGLDTTNDATYVWDRLKVFFA